MSALRATVAFVLFAPVVVNAQSEAALWRFVFPNAKALISIDWARIRQSQAGAMLREKLLTARSMPIPAIPGIELLNDIDRILISSPGNKTPEETAQPPVLIAIYGHFDPAKVREVFTRFGAKPQSYDSFQVYRPQGKQLRDLACVLFDRETILFGDARSVFATLDRNRLGPPSLPESTAGSMIAHAAEMESNYDFWVIMDATEIMSNDSVAALLHGGEWASEARGLEAGVSLRAGLAADITVRFSSDAIAKRVTTELTRVINLAAKDKSTGAQVQDIAKKLKLIADASAAKISLRLTQQEMEKSAQSFAAAQEASSRKSSSNVNPKFTLTPTPTPAKPGVIRIEGLDDGPREIPYQAPQQ